MSEIVIGEDGLARPPWAATDPLLRDYYDTEWGMPVRDERGVFERLSLEAFQSGLSWATILRKRPAFREAFAGFDHEVVAGFDERDVERLLGDAGIVRHRGKIAATIDLARLSRRLRSEGSSLSGLVWSFAPPPRPSPLDPTAELPASTPESVAMSKDLKRRGWRFVGPTTAYAFQQAMGLVNDHDADLLVVGNRGINSLTGRLLGSVPADVARQSDCDVMIVHTVA